MGGSRPKISEIFEGAVLASGAILGVIYLSLAVCAAARRTAWTRAGEPKICFRHYSLAMSV